MAVGEGILKTAGLLPTSREGCNRFEQGCRMIRFVVILPIIFAAWMLLVTIISDVKKANVDWTGVTTIIGFIALAFWLRHVTGMG
jgi:hypothetical protein